MDERIEYETVPEVYYDTEVAYDNVENLISAMKLSTVEEETLRLLYNSQITNVEIAKLLSLKISSFYARRKRIQNKYLTLTNK